VVVIHREAAAVGVDLVGITSPVADPQVAQRYGVWIAEGSHGEMAYLERHAPAKADPRAYQPDCRSILCFGLSYRQEAPQPAGHGRVARYAWGRDYHQVLGGALKQLSIQLEQSLPGERFRAAVDATPLLETHLGRDADLGFLGKHTLLINQRLGSWFVLGEILTTAALPAAAASNHGRRRCGVGCTHCIDVCPTRAIVAPHKLDARRCIAYLTIEHQGSIPEELRPAMGDWLFGCDLCQEVCPWNVRAEWTRSADFLQHRAGPAVDLAEVLALEDDAAFRARFAGTPLIRAKRVGLVRNACVVAANTGATRLLPRLRVLSRDQDHVIAEHARWAVARLTGAT